jgi:hypothetical protein
MEMANDFATFGYHVSNGSLGSDSIFNGQLQCMYEAWSLLRTTNFNTT